MMKLFLITITDTPFHVGAKNLEELIKAYPNARIIEHVSDKLIVNTGDRYDALVAAHNFIKTGANTYSNEERIALVDLLHNLIK
jgi:N12 class adenine-specific DNA methylase